MTHLHPTRPERLWVWLRRLVSPGRWIGRRKRPQTDEGTDPNGGVSPPPPDVPETPEEHAAKLAAARAAMKPKRGPKIPRRMIAMRTPGAFIVSKTGKLYQVGERGEWKKIGKIPDGETFDPGPDILVVRDV